MPSGAAAAAGHRRIQSTQAMMGQFGAGGGIVMPAPGIGGYGMPGMGIPNLDASGALGLGLGATQGSRGGHGRRHSMNVLNKNPNPDVAGISANFVANDLDGYGDGFTPPAAGAGGHSRQPSRADPSWRGSKFASCSAMCNLCLIINSLFQMVKTLRSISPRRLPSSTACSNSVQHLVAITRRWPLSASQTCCPI